VKNLLLITGLLFILVGCGSTSKEPFYWGKYSTTLYDYKKNPGQEKLDAHKKELLSIMETSAKKNKLVPPGVNAEYGYILLQEGNEQEGLEYLSKEVELYPESEVFITRLKDEYKKGKK
jgi:hypothetical protein